MLDLPVSLRLRRAILQNDLLLVKRIIKHNPEYLENPNFADKANTSLHLAAILGHLDLLKLLVDLGHDAYKEESIKKGGSSSAPGISFNTDSSTALHLAAFHGHTKCVDYLCDTFPQTIDWPDGKGATPLMLAAQRSNPTSFPQSTSLVPPQQRPRATSNSSEDTSTLALLIKKGASVTAIDNEGNNALHYASAWGNLKAFRLLMSAGANPGHRNEAKCTPADYAISVQAGAYFRGLVTEFERLKDGNLPLPPPPPKTKLQLKVKDADLVGKAASSGGGYHQKPLSPVSPMSPKSPKSPSDTRLAKQSSGKSSKANPAGGPPGGVRLVLQDDVGSPVEEAPLTARRIETKTSNDDFGKDTHHHRFGRRFSS